MLSFLVDPLLPVGVTFIYFINYNDLIIGHKAVVSSVVSCVEHLYNIVEVPAPIHTTHKVGFGIGRRYRDMLN